MAKKSYSLEFNGLTSLMKQFEELAKEENMRKVREAALQTAFEKMQNGIVWNHGGDETITYKIKSDKPLHESGKSTIGIGFIFEKGSKDKGGVITQYLMFGTPHIKADKALYKSLHSKAVRDAANKAGEDAALKLINEMIG